MVFEIIELIIIVISIYGAALEWVRVKDHKTNDKWEFFAPAIFLAAVVGFMFFTGLAAGGGGAILSLSSLVCAVAAMPLLIALVYTGSLQDAQIAAGVKTYSEGQTVWLISDIKEFRDSFSRFVDDELNGWSEAKERRLGGSGTITKIFVDKTVTLEFDDSEKFDFPFESLMDSEPEIEEVSVESAEKGWWESD